MDWQTAIAGALQQRVQSHTFRQRRPLKILDATHVEIQCEIQSTTDTDRRLRLVNFASNNYLGLTHHPAVITAFESAARSNGVGSGAAGLITGHTDLHEAAERTLANWKGAEACVLLSSGFAANSAAVQALASVHPNVRFLVDKLAHASLIDAVQNTGLYRVFPHNHLGKLRRLLEEADPHQLQVVVTESIFSMDGDAADLRGIVALKQEFPFLLLLDEAHASGVYGHHGAGYASELGLQDEVDLTIITLSKALGCFGGAICSSKALIDSIINFGRPFIFSTNIPAAVAAAAAAAIGVLETEPQHQQRVRMLAKKVRDQLLAAGHTLPAGDSPIIPIILGEEAKTLAAAERLQSQGILTIAVRPPTVARGASRLRLTISSEHTDAEVEQLIDAVRSIR